jgi:hypothetical protein
VEYPYISDHAPVLLQLGMGFPIVAYPFKFNLDWLRDDRLISLVKEVWDSLQAEREEGAQVRLVRKLKFLKSRVKI